MVVTKSLNTRISLYKQAIESGELQETYQSLVSIVQNLRTEFSKRFDGEYAVAGVLHGYLDFTYFYIQNSYLKSHKLKLAVVLNHQQVQFELWLLGQTKDVQKHYWHKLKGTEWVDTQCMPDYSVFEVPLLEDPDFDNLNELSKSVHSEFESLSIQIFKALKSHEE
ncbi:hypothetical protein [Pseudoalteromonas sp. Of7M-16]|uniref:DUF7000 family protein n=1 Tax=Pseudoalteromonas sp. Of7M-16 TaxID=2917756 RepID=UPI001EF4AC5E|nr:hypothetical protein [Pseudoalteromonas sp. Of7M-16]MCG7550532.1 hypothetical protein [Pseudoalteromonas sp. Of7M-16]